MSFHYYINFIYFQSLIIIFILQFKNWNCILRKKVINNEHFKNICRCEELLKLVSRKKAEPSDAEKEFMAELQTANEKCVAYGTRIDKQQSKMKYQELQVATSTILV